MFECLICNLMQDHAVMMVGFRLTSKAKKHRVGMKIDGQK